MQSVNQQVGCVTFWAAQPAKLLVKPCRAEVASEQRYTDVHRLLLEL